MGYFQFICKAIDRQALLTKSRIETAFKLIDRVVYAWICREWFGGNCHRGIEGSIQNWEWILLKSMAGSYEWSRCQPWWQS